MPRRKPQQNEAIDLMNNWLKPQPKKGEAPASARVNHQDFNIVHTVKGGDPFTHDLEDAIIVSLKPKRGSS